MLPDLWHTLSPQAAPLLASGTDHLTPGQVLCTLEEEGDRGGSRSAGADPSAPEK